MREAEERVGRKSVIPSALGPKELEAVPCVDRGWLIVERGVGAGDDSPSGKGVTDTRGDSGSAELQSAVRSDMAWQRTHSDSLDRFGTQGEEARQKSQADCPGREQRVSYAPCFLRPFSILTMLPEGCPFFCLPGNGGELSGPGFRPWIAHGSTVVYYGSPHLSDVSLAEVQTYELRV